MDKITKEMMIKEIFLLFPEKAEELAAALSEYGVRCVTCCASAWETLEEGLKSHGMTSRDIEKIVANLNSILQN